MQGGTTMLKFNKAILRDKIYACWMGKNIGGTLGGPYEGRQQINDVQGFVTKPGEVLPNDDLDLQLIWLKAMEEQGPDGVNAQVLGEYWLSFIGPTWNEYGVGKSNLRAGMPAPMSGEYNNEYWKHSNGAWIRTEIWACLYPGNVEKAIEYAFADASVDHGFGEGSYAAIFVAAMESAAFVFNDIETLLQIGLSKIPADCRIARSVNIVRDAYKSGKTWQQARQLVVEDSADLGWFQAPANVAFVVIGLLYGEGDFKRSMILAVNCGDDTDCTGATIGSIMGIMGGTAFVPKDWSEHLGDKIEQMCLLNGHGNYPTTLTELTDVVMNMLPITLHIPFFRTSYKTNYLDILVYDGENEFSEITPESYYGTSFVEANFGKADYCVIAKSTYIEAKVELLNKPEIQEEGIIRAKITAKFRGNVYQQHCNVNWYLPEGWTVRGKKDLHIMKLDHYKHPCNEGIYEITAGQNVVGCNHIVVELKPVDRSESAFASFTIMG